MSSPMKPLLPLAVGLALGVWLARRTRPQPQESPNRQAQLQQQIRQLKEGYEKQDRIRRDFTANVSHELKTPLTSISGYAEILREGMVKSEDVGRFAGKIYEEAQRLIALVEDILNLSHLDEGAPGQERRCGIDLYALCARALTRLEEAARQRKITLTLTGACQRVDGAEKLLEEILFNLCDNAIKYNKEGGRVEVSVTREAQWVVLTVQDTGIGIPSGRPTGSSSGSTGWIRATLRRSAAPAWACPSSSTPRPTTTPRSTSTASWGGGPGCRCASTPAGRGSHEPAPLSRGGESFGPPPGGGV